MNQKFSNGVFHRAGFLKIVTEETRSLHVHTHRGEDDRKRLLRVIGGGALGTLLDQTGLPADLRGDLVVRQARGREERDLLASGDRGHGVDSRNARLDHFSRVGTLVRVDRLTL